MGRERGLPFSLGGLEAGGRRRMNWRIFCQRQALKEPHPLQSPNLSFAAEKVISPSCSAFDQLLPLLSLS